MTPAKASMVRFMGISIVEGSDAFRDGFWLRPIHGIQGRARFGHSGFLLFFHGGEEGLVHAQIKQQ